MIECLDTARLDTLFAALTERGYRIVGPTVRDGAIVYEELESADQLPVGWTDEQAPGRYRLHRREDQRVFGYVVGPHSWKRALFPPRESLVQIRRGPSGGSYAQKAADGPPMAFVGVRACELAAIAIQDKVLTGGPFVDPRYRDRRERCLIIAVNCTSAGSLCFCTSMETGPEVRGDYDVRVTELDEELLLEAGSARGRELLLALPTRTASEPQQRRAASEIDACRHSMGRALDTRDLPARLMGNLSHPRWDEVAERCLSCGNCTSVCPTCFCFDVSDTSDLSGEHAGRERVWDSCFNPDHSAIHGGAFRPNTRTRYQQWATHKLATWTSQFGTSGCVGCGRCIAWCPVGIDLTEEVSAIATGPAAPLPLPAPASYPLGTTDGQLPTPVQVLRSERETHDVVTLRLATPAGYTYQHGQFNMLSLPGIGDVPLSISGTAPGEVWHTIRAVGAATRALSALDAGDVVGMRGPFGSHWPLERVDRRPVMLIAGGIGLAPLRTALLSMKADPEAFPHVRLLYGTRTPADLLFRDELLQWTRGAALRAHVTVDRCDSRWKGNIGVVTTLMRRKRVAPDGVYFICGPEVMMGFVLQELALWGVPDENIYVSMERNMKCAVGLCGRCQYGPYFICKDGPVFRHDRIASIFGKPGF